jgi:recombination protein RecR
LSARVRAEAIREAVVATPLSVEGEATALYLAQVLKPAGIKVSRIASGLPHGGELEFADQITLGRALDGRREL